MTTSFRRTRLAAGALVVFATGFGIGFWLSSRSAGVADDTAAAPPMPAPSDAPAAAPTLPAATASHASPRATAAAPRPELPLLDPTTAPAGEGGPVSRDQIAAAHDRRRLELESSFASEVTDGAWSPGAEQALFAAAASEEASLAEQTPLDFRSECRSSTCRIDARFAAEADADGWVSLYLLASAGTLAGADSLVTMREDGTFDVTIYGRRP